MLSNCPVIQKDYITSLSWRFVSWILLGIPVGIVLLYFGSEWMVDGAKKMAVRLGVTPFVIGLTVVAFGSSSPEVITSLVSGDTPQIILGNVVGSNIANVGLAIGLAALISPIACKFSEIRFEVISMMVAVFVVTLMALTGALGFIEGAILVAALFVFVFLAYRLKKDNKKEEPQETPIVKEEDKNAPMWKSAVMVVLGIVLLYFGATVFIDGAVELATIFGISELMIGLIVIAVGTSLPELCICLLAAYRKENEIVVSNIVGSIVFNSFFALGVGVLFTTVPVSYYTLVFHLPMMILMAGLLALMIRSGNKIVRWEGALLVGIYIVYIALMGLFPELTQGIV